MASSAYLRAMMRLALPLAFLLGACTPSSAPAPDAILAIGDSVMAWNGDAGIPEVVETALRRPVVDASRSGARLTTDSRLAAATGFDISAQFTGTGWDWVIMTGGGNDLRDLCATSAVTAARDGQIDASGQGDIPDLIARIRASGARVAFVGYYDGAEASPTGFTPCQPTFDVINARMADLAARMPGVLFLDAGDVIDPTDRGLYARDLVHPSARGSALIGRALAAAILRAEGA